MERQLQHKATQQEFSCGKSGYFAVQAQVADYLVGYWPMCSKCMSFNNELHVLSILETQGGF
jgi:hypothetical protein